jgi:hypothetical protein
METGDSVMNRKDGYAAHFPLRSLPEWPNVYHGAVTNGGTRPRIAVFTKSLDNWTSGSGHHLNEILSATLDQNDGRFDFTFVHYRPSENPIYQRVRELIVPRDRARAAFALRRERFDVVHYAPLTIFA